MEVVFNGNQLPYTNGSYTQTIEFNESLDNGTIIIPQVAKTPFKPFKSVLKIDNKYWVLSRYNRKSSGLGKHNYTLTLVSPTIYLQRVVLPNRTITQNIDGSEIITVGGYIRRLLTYEKYLFEQTGWRINAPSSDIKIPEILETMEAPEFSWNKPTLFEALNDLYMLAGCCVTAKILDLDNKLLEIDYIDLKETKNEIDLDILNVSKIEVQENGDGLTNQFDLDMENALNEKSTQFVTESLTIRSPNNAITGTAYEGSLYLDGPIEYIEKVYVKFPFISGDSFEDTLEWRKFDITSKVVVKDIYDRALISNSAGSVSGNYKRDRIWYQRGENTINGLFYTDETWFVGASSVPSIINIIKNVASPKIDPSWKDLVFEVIYKKVGNENAIISKYDSILEAGRMNANQENAYVNIQLETKKHSENIERLGNGDMLVQGRVKNILDLPQNGDYLVDSDERYVMSKITIIQYDTHFGFIAILTKDFIKKTFYSGINSQKRYTRLATKEQSTIRSEVEIIRYVIRALIEAYDFQIEVEPVENEVDVEYHLVNYLGYELSVNQGSGVSLDYTHFKYPDYQLSVNQGNSVSLDYTNFEYPGYELNINQGNSVNINYYSFINPDYQLNVNQGNSVSVNYTIEKINYEWEEVGGFAIENATYVESETKPIPMPSEKLIITNHYILDSNLSEYNASTWKVNTTYTSPITERVIWTIIFNIVVSSGSLYDWGHGGVLRINTGSGYIYKKISHISGKPYEPQYYESVRNDIII